MSYGEGIGRNVRRAGGCLLAADVGWVLRLRGAGGGMLVIGAVCVNAVSGESGVVGSERRGGCSSLVSLVRNVTRAANPNAVTRLGAPLYNDASMATTQTPRINTSAAFIFERASCAARAFSLFLKKNCCVGLKRVMVYCRYSVSEKLSLVLFTALLVMGLVSTFHKLQNEKTPVIIARCVILTLLVPIQFAILLDH